MCQYHPFQKNIANELNKKENFFVVTQPAQSNQVTQQKYVKERIANLPHMASSKQPQKKSGPRAVRKGHPPGVRRGVATTNPIPLYPIPAHTVSTNPPSHNRSIFDSSPKS